MFEISLGLWGCLGVVQLNPNNLKLWWRVYILGFGFMKVAGVIFDTCSQVRLTAAGY